jgi:guanylate kinase
MQNIFIISGPAGSGKDAVIEALEKLLPITRVITTTTRAPRPGETDGHPYYFISRALFEQGIARNAFIEYSTNENAWYGVTHEELDRVAHAEGIGIWKVDWKGVVTAKKLFPHIIALFISAPLDILESRLRKRDLSEKNESYFRERMAYTREWLNHTDIYDYIIENEEGKLDETVRKVSALIKERSSTL